MHLKKFKTLLPVMVMVTVILFTAMLLPASGDTGGDTGGDIMVSLRFYEGTRVNEPAKDRVVTTYHLKPMFVGNMFDSRDIKKEQRELRRVFNLFNLKLMTSTRFAWQAREKDKRFQVIILNGHEFQVQLKQTAKPDGFVVDVLEMGKQEKSLLHTDISLPQRKTAVFGFEDSMGKPFFLSFYREKNDNVIRDEPVELPEGVQPKLVKRVNPKYPKDALKYKVEGRVILSAEIDTSGKVVNVNILHGHPLLTGAAIVALKKWRYEPHTKEGEKTPAQFTVTLEFSLPDSVNKNKRAPHFIFPTKGYFTSPFGMRKHPLTGKKAMHDGIDIAAKLGKPVVAAANGVVLKAEFQEHYGNLIILEHKNGYTSRYAQLKDFAVKKGDKVKQGQLIGHIGSSGRSSAPHLHWEVRLDGKPLDPFSLVKD